MPKPTKKPNPNLKKKGMKVLKRRREANRKKMAYPFPPEGLSPATLKELKKLGYYLE